MQKIFYNAKINTMNANGVVEEALLVNGDSIVLVGNNEEVLSMKVDGMELIDLNDKKVFPTFAILNFSIYSLIEDEIKNAKNFKKLENPDDFDENYEKFNNYDIYKTEFLKIQEKVLNKGISTIQEVGMHSKEFIFWKKIADEKLLKLDVVGYVDIKQAKNVMDDNCSSYRKYKNGFRLGGYSLALDGDLFFKQAWLKFNYRNEHGYKGYTDFYDEELIYLIKTALEEKKQLIVETNGDASLEQFLRCFEEVKIKEKVEDTFRPVALKCNFLNKKHVEKMKQLNITPSFQITDLSEHKQDIIKVVGKLKFKKSKPIVLVEKLNHEYLVHGNRKDLINAFELIENYSSKKLSKSQKTFDKNLLKMCFNKATYILFDEEQKGTLENGKKANFIVLDETNNIQEVYIFGEKIK